MNILSIHNGPDTGGQSIRIKQAFDKLTDWTFRCAVNPVIFAYIDYPTDLPWRDAKKAWSEADLVHLHNDFRTAAMFERSRGEKPAVIHYHGSAYRGEPYSRLAEQRRRKATGIVSTLDLWLIAPGKTEWVPSPYDLDFLASLR